MRRDDIQLRDAARRGDSRACIEIAQRYFTGSAALPRNAKLGLAYLQAELQRGNPQAETLVANFVPLELIVAHKLQHILHRATELGLQNAMLKWGIELAMSPDTLEAGSQFIRRSELHGVTSPEELRGAAKLARFLGSLSPEIVNPRELILQTTRRALAERDLARASYCSALAGELIPDRHALAALVAQTVHLAASCEEPLSLQVDLVERCLETASLGGDSESTYALGCAYADLPYGTLQPRQLALRRDIDRAATLLLRAADAGHARAWWHLSQNVSAVRAPLSSHGVGRFFLEKAAIAGVLEAQTRLGAVLLKEATDLQHAESGVRWLAGAAERGCQAARDLLHTLILPIPELPPEYERRIIQRIAAMDRELGIRMEVARSLHLTRREAMAFNAVRDIKEWGLLIPGASYENPKGRLAPAVSSEMKLTLQRTAEFFAGSSALQNTLLVQRNRTQKHAFKLLAVPEEAFFATEIGRSRSHYGYGRHWAVRTANVLETLQPKIDARGRVGGKQIGA